MQANFGRVLAPDSGDPGEEENVQPVPRDHLIVLDQTGALLQ